MNCERKISPVVLVLATVAVLVSLFLAPIVWAQAPASENRSAASPAQAVSAAEVPRLIKFSGTLLDAQEQPLAGPVGVTFALHAQQTGGAALWMETQNVEPDAHGNYTILLGSNSAKGVPAELFVSGEARWLEVQAERQAAHERILLVSVPYALKAGDAETLGGKPASAFLTSETLTSAGTSAAAATATPGALLKSSTATTGKKAASTPQFAACSGLTSNGSATINSIGLFTTACNIQSSVITQSGSNVGIGTAAPAVAMDIVGNNAGLRLSGTGTHQVTVTGASSGRLGEDLTGFFFASDTNGKGIKFLTNNKTLNEWMRITSAGNVGIGTQTPAAKLEVDGTARFVAPGVVGSSSVFFLVSASPDITGLPELFRVEGGPRGGQIKMGLGNGLNPGLHLSMASGTAADVSTMVVAGDGGTVTIGAGNGGNGTVAGSTNGRGGSILLQAGNAGIGAGSPPVPTFNPSSSISLAAGAGGGVDATTMKGGLGGGISVNAGPGGSVSVSTQFSGDGGTVTISGGSAGVGSTGLPTSVGNGGAVTISGGGPSTCGPFCFGGKGGSVTIQGGTRGGNVLLAPSSGFVGVGTSTPSNTLEVIAGGTTLADAWTVRSSRRWKSNIQPLAGALQKVQRLRGVSYDQISDGKHQIGVIAEEVGQVLPELVTYEKNGVDAQGVDYARLTALLIEATKEQQAQISEQQAAIRALRSEVELLRRQPDR